MDTSPFVSIIVPVYNVETYLGKCLNSLVQQTYQNIEIICVNDGSTDDCANILNRFAIRDKRIKVITQDNMGLSAARNTGIKHATGKYTMFVDSDDWIDAETCGTVTQIAEENGADVVFWSYVREFADCQKEKYMFWEDGTVFDENQVKDQLHRRLCGLLGEELAHPEYANAMETAWAKLFRTDMLTSNHIEFVDTKIIGTEDALFSLYAFGYVKRAVYIKKCFYHYRKTNQSSLTKKYNDQLFERWKNLFLYMRNYIDANQLPGTYHLALDNRISLSLLGLGLNIIGSDMSFPHKITCLNEILHDPLYQSACKNLDFSYFPIHWKLFYGCARHRFASGVYVLLKVIQKIIS